MRANDFMAGGSFAPRRPETAGSGRLKHAGYPPFLGLVRTPPSLPEEDRDVCLESSADGSHSPIPPTIRFASLSALALAMRGEEALPRAASLLPLAVPRLDALLAGGLRRDALHEIRSVLSRDNGAATGFAAAILARLAAIDRKPILWIAEKASADEAGILYGVGLDGLGLDPGRLIVVRVRKPVDVLWVAEEGLACRGLAAVVAEIKGSPRLLDLTATRRLALRARSGVMGLLLRQSDSAEPSAATTRWRAEPLPATTLDGYAAGIGRPAWRLVLERNRRGATGTTDVEWDHGRQSLAAITGDLAQAAHSFALPAVSLDRPPAPPDAGKVVSLPIPVPWTESEREVRRRIARAR
jgi:protein ImuA